MLRECFACEEMAECTRVIGVWLCRDCWREYWRHTTTKNKTALEAGACIAKGSVTTCENRLVYVAGGEVHGV